MIGCRKAQQRAQKKTWRTVKTSLKLKKASDSRKVINLPCAKTSRAIIVFGAPPLSVRNKRQNRQKAWKNCCRELRIGTSKTKADPGGLVRVALFWKSHCATCSPACVILYHLIRFHSFVPSNFELTNVVKCSWEYADLLREF